MKQTLFLEPTNSYIPPIMGLAKLAKLAFDGVDLTPIWKQLTSKFSGNTTDSVACLDMCASLMDMSIVDQILGNADRGLAFQAQAVDACRLYQLPAKTSPAKLKVLGLATADKINANIPLEFLIEDSDVTLYLMYIVPGKPLPLVPEHDLAIVLVADSENARPVLQEIESLVTNWPRPVLNLPSLVPHMGRERLYKVLAPLSGVVIPATIRVDRSTLMSVGWEKFDVKDIFSGGDFPLIIRPVDSHAGQGLEKINGVSEITPYLSRQTEEEFHISRFVDYRSQDGMYRKYRIAVIDGEAFPCHLAVSDHWMIHYLNAGMLENADKRAEEKQFMNRFREEFGLRHRRAIAEMAKETGLDYFGIDCSEMPDGKLLVFEASTALVVHNMDPADIFPYKASHMHNVFEAFRAMMHRASAPF